MIEGGTTLNPCLQSEKLQTLGWYRLYHAITVTCFKYHFDYCGVQSNDPTDQEKIHTSQQLFIQSFILVHTHIHIRTQIRIRPCLSTLGLLGSQLLLSQVSESGEQHEQNHSKSGRSGTTVKASDIAGTLGHAVVREAARYRVTVRQHNTCRESRPSSSALN